MILSNKEKEFHKIARESYDERIELGIAKEQARKDIPLCNYTEAYWKIDLKNLLHFLSLRMEEHAQKEIRDYANFIGNQIVSQWVPYTWNAFKDYQLEGILLSKQEQEIITKMFYDSKNKTKQTENLLEKYGFIKRKEKEIKFTLEGKEFKEKLKKLDISNNEEE
jgi:thymidylate synthase (FAD)